ncbi:PTS transporter subunit EIIC [Candidatus Poriferisodalis sp.]|uniref:PTS transporter subunit EIIC n=1 Tax=Candidatus Poriferisodalis sp. TaxID=3101277 RepID=UPI003B0231B6
MLQRVQRVGGFLSSMVIPNIGAFIAWGLITALFIPRGWLAKTSLDWDWGAITDNTVAPMIKFLLPILVAYTGGKLIHGHRGGVLAAVALLGVIGGSSFELASGATGDPPQFLGAMLIGPLAGLVMREIDKWLEDRRPAGFEMLFNNFSQGIAGVLMAMLGYIVIGPIVSTLAEMFGNMVEGISDAGLLPLMDLPIEVGKVLFLNNAINHGVLTPLGAIDVTETGRSIYFMLESNPGPGLGLLLAYWFAGQGLAKLSAPGAIIIHFFGGIHEVYFPYVLMNPVMIGAMWAGGILADIVFVIFDAGLTGPPSPGSIFAYLPLTPSSGAAAAGVYLGMAVSAAAAFFVGSILLRLFPVAEIDDTEDDDTSVADAMEGVPMG